MPSPALPVPPRRAQPAETPRAAIVVVEDPTPQPAVVPAVEVAERAGFVPPHNADLLRVAARYVDDATTDVEAYLGRPVVPVEVAETGLYANPDGWLLGQRPVVQIVRVEPERDADGALLGTFTVTYLTGLDAANSRVLAPIRRYIAAHAGALLRQDPNALAYGTLARTITSLNVEGQGVTYADRIGQQSEAKPGSGAPGSLPNLATLDRWRVAGRRVYQRPG